MKFELASLGAVALLAVACGGSAVQGASDAGASGSTSAGGPDAGVGGPGAGAGGPSSSPCLDTPCPDTAPRPTPLPSPKCPEIEPIAGSVCAEAELHCGYGDSPAANCRRSYTCQSSAVGSAWTLDSVTNTPACNTPGPDQCPAQPMARTSCDARDLGLACAYPGLTCQCDERFKGGFGWSCFGAPENPACPARQPNVGQGCVPNGLACDYVVDGCDAPPNVALECVDGAWAAVPVDFGCVI